MKVTISIDLDVDTKAWSEKIANTEGMLAGDVRRLIRRDVRTLVTEAYLKDGLLLGRSDQPQGED